jgi:hypothetical protein
MNGFDGELLEIRTAQSGRFPRPGIEVAADEAEVVAED